MSTEFQAAVRRYCTIKKHSKGTSDEYKATVRKWINWGQEIPLEQLSRSSIRDFLDWVYDQAVEQGGENPERTSNKARDHIRAVVAWAWENDIIETLPRFPKPRSQRDVAGRQYLSKAELNALYFATYELRRPRAWRRPHSVGQYWRSAIVLFFNYGLDTGTIWKTKTTHEPLLWRHVFWNHESPDRQSKLRSRYGWLFYRREKNEQIVLSADESSRCTRICAGFNLQHPCRVNRSSQVDRRGQIRSSNGWSPLLEFETKSMLNRA